MNGCTRCRLPYPAELVTAMNVNGRYVNVCGICALEISNELHGDNRKAFNGEMAELFRLDAVEWRQKHPNAKPVSEQTEAPRP